FRALLGGAIKRCIRQLRIGDRNAKAGAKLTQLLLVEQFLFMGDVASLTTLSESVAFDSFGEDDGRCAVVLHRGFVRPIDLLRVMAAAPHFMQLLVREVTEHLQQAWIMVAYVLTDVGTISDGVFLEFTINDFAQAAYQDAVMILGQQWVPIAA